MTSNWWANKLGTTPVPQQPSYQGVAIPQQQAPQTPNAPQNYPTMRTPVGDRCPGCGSGNYGGATPDSRKRCYDCGYPIQQSGSGMGTGIVGQGGQSSGPVQAATQVPTGGFNPQTIIGHI
jgi:hypothetical protein